MHPRKNIRQLSRQELEAYFEEIGQPRYRASQVFQWLWQKSAIGFDMMHNLPRTLRAKLSEDFILPHLTIDYTARSKDDTIKYRFRLHDGLYIEGVLIPAGKRVTACISSQVGCSLTCSFCATGKLKRARNLKAEEIYDQVAVLNRQSLQHFGKPLTNIVLMGMGEPLLNYAQVMRAIRLITGEDGMGISPKRITLSTAGIVKMIYRMADDGVAFNLAISLHAATDEKRQQIMPINRENTIAQLLDSLRYFYHKTRNEITYEYILFKGFNDTAEDARHLARLCKHFPVKVNLIEYNPVDGVGFTSPGGDGLNAFGRMLRDQGVRVTIRRSRGRDIDAACGQLANKTANLKGAENIQPA